MIHNTIQNRLLSPLGLMCLILLCSQCQKTELDFKTDENYVFNVILNQDEVQQAGLYIISDSTAVYAALDSTVLGIITKTYGKPLPASLVAHFKQRNEVNHDISLLFDTLFESKFLADLKVDSDMESLSTIYADYPNLRGIYTFSRVGFNPTRDMALVYVGTFREGTIGEGNYFILQKAQDTWEIQKKVPLWSIP